MIILASYTVPAEARAKLKTMGTLVLLRPQPGVYKSIASHPDIFFCVGPNCLYISPALSEELINKLRAVHFFKGSAPPLNNYPASARYNAVMAHGVFIHNLKATDPALLLAAQDMEQIHVKQAYTRCNLICLSNSHFITSDKGIEKTLLSYGKRVCYISPRQVSLSGHPHGFIGGACGMLGQTLYVCGGLSHLNEAEELKQFLTACDWGFVELYKGPPSDVGSVLFVREQ
jgi:hypothetical protein